MIKKYTLVFLLIFNFIYSQQPGDLDITFGVNGKVQSNFANGTFKTKSQVVQSDGKIVLAGELNNGIEIKGFIFRLNSDGSLDATFNTTGRVIHPFVGGFEVVKLQTDGKIVVGGTYNNDAAVARYNSNGTPDLGFAIDGTFYNSDLNNPPSSQRIVHDLEIQTDGKILGLTTLDLSIDERDYLVFRLNTNGIEDSNFIIADGFGEYVFPKSLELQTNGKIIVSGNYTDSTSRMFLSRYNSDGTVDTTFNATGKQIVNITGATTLDLNDVVIQTDGKIVASGKYNASTSVLFLIRFNVNGSFDTTFSGDGLAGVNINTDFNTNLRGRVLVQPDGKIILMDIEQNSTTNLTDIVLIRFTATGLIDTTFNTNGGVFLSFYTNNDSVGDFTLVNDKLIISGNTEEFF